MQGKYNLEDSNNTYADIIGNGSSNTKRSNASTVDWQGNAWYAGDVYVGSTSGKNKDDGSKKLATEEYVNSAISSSGGSGSNVQADWQQNDETANDYIKNRPGGYGCLTEILPETTLNFTDSFHLSLTNCPPIEVGIEYIVTFYHPNSDNTEYKLVGKNDSRGMGYACIGNETYTWGGGTDTTTPFLIYTGGGTPPTGIYISSSETLPCTYNINIKAMVPVKIDEKYLDIKNTNIVDGSEKGSLRTVGSAGESSGYTIGGNAFTEGYNTKASGYASHAEGNGTKASGNSSHAEGATTKASGNCSHAEGNSTKASSSCQHAQGKYNIEDTDNTYADIIGNGSSNTKKSNAATVDWKGNAWFAGDVYVGSTSGTNKDEGSKKLATEEYVDLAISSSGGSGSNVQSDWPGNVLITSTNRNPAEYLGGTWELIDKGFKHNHSNVTFDKYVGDEDYYGADGYQSCYSKYCFEKMEVFCLRSHSTVRLRINFYLKKGAIFDDVGASGAAVLHFSDFGFTTLGAAYNDIPCYTDTLNAKGLLMTILHDGIVRIDDILVDNPTSNSQLVVPSTHDEALSIDITTPISLEHMLDDFCDKFYWKRIK